MPEQPKPDVAKKQRARKLVRGLAKTYGDVECALVHDSAFQLLVATILSAQCTDERVNATTPALFERFPTAADLAKSTQRQVEKIIHPLGFFRAKATNIRRMASRAIQSKAQLNQTKAHQSKARALVAQTQVLYVCFNF